MSTLRVGIIGVGGMGSHDANLFFQGKVPGAELTAACDTNPERLKAVKAQWGDKVRYFESAEEFFSSKTADAVLVITPHYFHPPLAIQAFEHGLHVLIDKPAGVYTKQVREMNEAAARSGKVFGIMFNQRCHPLFRKIRDLVSSGELGTIMRTGWVATDWFRAQSYYDSGGWRATWEGEGGGVLLNQCPHNLDLWQWMCGMPRKVRAFCSFGRYHDIEVEDDVTAYVQYESGATGTFIASTGEAPGTNRLEIAATRGRLVFESGKLSWQRTRVPVDQFTREYKGGFGNPETWEVTVPTEGEHEGHLGICKNWVAAIQSGAPMLAPGVEGINSLQISNAMLLSAWTDETIDLPVDEDRFYKLLQEKVKKSKNKKAKKSGKSMKVDGSFNTK